MNIANIPLHPIIVHFPIALLIASFIFNVLSLIFRRDSWRKTAWHIYIFGALLSVAAVLSGQNAEEIARVHHPLLETHEMFALIVMWTSLVSLLVLWFLQKKFGKIYPYIFCAVTLALALLVSTTGFYGGKMVYEYGVGVEK